MNKLILIYNWKIKKDESFPSYLDTIGVKYRVFDNADDGEHRLAKWYKIINTLECIKLAVDALRCAEEGDVIVSMCSTPGIFASILNKKRIKILVLNLLCHTSDKPGVIEKLRNHIYRKALNKSNVWATCNAQEDVQKYNQMFSIGYSGHVVHLPDGIEMENNYFTEADNTEQDCNIDVFSCGASARDWDTLLKAAMYLPQVQFHIVARKSYLKGKHMGENVHVEYEIPHELYLKRLLQSKIVVLPLNSDVTAGLLVYFDAIKYNKLPLITLTNSTKQFSPHSCIEELSFPMKDADTLEKKIKLILDMEENEYLWYLTRIKHYVYDNFSIESYNKRLFMIIKEVVL